MTAREAELTQQLAESQQALVVALRENQLLRQKVDLLVRRVFGSSSEKLDSAQLQLLQLSEAPAVSEPLSAAPAKAPRAPRARSPKAPRIPDNLPVVEEVIDPEPVKAQPDNWRQIGQEVTEQLDYEPGRFFKRRTRRRP
jgi:transposase